MKPTTYLEVFDEATEVEPDSPQKLIYIIITLAGKVRGFQNS